MSTNTIICHEADTVELCGRYITNFVFIVDVAIVVVIILAAASSAAVVSTNVTTGSIIFGVNISYLIC